MLATILYFPPGCWAVSQTLRSWVPQVCSPPMLSLSRGCWRMRLPLEAAQETASVPHSNTAASSSSTCTRWPPTRLTGQWIAETELLDPYSKIILTVILWHVAPSVKFCEEYVKCPTNLNVATYSRNSVSDHHVCFVWVKYMSVMYVLHHKPQPEGSNTAWRLSSVYEHSHTNKWMRMKQSRQQVIYLPLVIK